VIRTSSDVGLTSPDGLRLNLVDYGGTTSPPLLLIHGSFGHAHVWDSLVDALPSTRRAFALDLPGHGESEWGPDENRYAFDRLGQDVHVAVEAIGERPVLAGHSIGSAIAMFYAARYVETIAAAVFMDIDPHSPQHHVDHLNQVGEAPPKAYASFDRAISREARVAPGAAPHVHERLARFGYRATPDGFVQKFDQAFLRSVRTWDARPVLARITVPVLVIKGADSTAMSSTGYDELLRVLPSARGVVLRGAGHQVHLDQPLNVAAEVEGFVASLVR
jgi:pimeloyl-ACP methyl ester carboxylesterase